VNYDPVTGKAPLPAEVYPAARVNYKALIALAGLVLAAASMVGGLFHWYTVGLINEHALGGHPAQVKAVREALRNSNEQLEGALENIEETLDRLEAQAATGEQLKTLRANNAKDLGDLERAVTVRVEAYISGNDQRLKNIEEVVRETREKVRELARR
jgi:hypothetical protein